MSTFRLKKSDVSKSYLTPNTLPTLRAAFKSNNESFLKFINLGDRYLQSQNPIVRFLSLLNVNTEWDEEYLIAMVGATYKQNASLMNFNTTHKKGSNFIKALYPETNHNTFFVVPFAAPNDETISKYLNCPLEELVSFYPIYTTSKTHYWDISALYDGIDSMSREDIYTIVYIDPFALAIGHYRWLKERRTAECQSGYESHYIISYPVMNYYKYHNELVNLNYLHGNHNPDIYGPSWAFVNYKDRLTKTCKWLDTGLMKTNLKSFTNFTKFCPVLNPDVDRDKMLFTFPDKEMFFPNLNWVYTLANLKNAETYLKYVNFLGYSDGQVEYDLKTFYKPDKSFFKSCIKDPVWLKHFYEVYDRIKELI